MKTLFFYTIIFIQIIIISSCRKDNVVGKNVECFNFGEVGNQRTYEIIRVENYGGNTVSIDTVFSELTSVSNNIYNFSNSTKWYQGSFFGKVRSLSPLKIDTLVKCDSKVGSIYETNSSGFNNTPKYTVASLNASFFYKNISLKCYKIVYYDGESSTTYYLNKKYGIVLSRHGFCPGGVGCVTITQRLIDTNF